MRHGRDHESPLRIHGDAQIHGLEQPHGIAETVGIQVRELLQGLDDGVADEVVDGDVGIDLPLFQRLLGLLPEGLDPARVGTQHVGELGGVLEGIVHALGDELPHVGHLHHLELGAFAGDVGMAGLPGLQVGALHGTGQTGPRTGRRQAAFGQAGLRESRQPSLRLGRRLHIPRNHPSIRPAPRNPLHINPLLLRNLTCPGRSGCFGVAGGGYTL